MMDTKEALKELEDLTVDYGDRNEEQIARLDEAIGMAMDALRDLPNRLRQAMDTISRKATIDAMESVDWYHIDKDGQLVHGANSKEDEPLYKAEDIYNVLEQLPSAEPEIIRCRECKFWTHIKRTNRYWCKTDDGLYDLNPSPDDFCSRAERRTDDIR